MLEETLENPSDWKEIKPVNPKGNQPWIYIGRTRAEAEAPILWPPDAKKPTRWKRPWCWERLKAKGEGGNRGWGGWMASPTHWTWVWASSRRQWRTGKPSVLQSMGLQRVRYNLTTEHVVFHEGRYGNHLLASGVTLWCERGGRSYTSAHWTSQQSPVPEHLSSKL